MCKLWIVKSEVITSCINSKHIALTFDDGPHDNTPNILKILNQYNIKATFSIFSFSHFLFSIFSFSHFLFSIFSFPHFLINNSLLIYFQLYYLVIIHLLLIVSELHKLYYRINLLFYYVSSKISMMLCFSLYSFLLISSL